MRWSLYPAILFALALGLAACTPPATDKPKEETGTTGASGSSKPETAATEPVPDALKHEGFKYYGLEATNEQSYEFDMNGSKREGSQKLTYKGLKDGKPQFTIERSGALQQIGTENVEVREDGVYIVSTDRMQALKTAMMALPAKLEVGKTWDITEDVKDDLGNDVKMKATNKIDGPEKLKTAAGEFDCMVVSMTGTLDSNGKKQTVSGKTWFAAGIGTVKLQVTSQSGKDKPVAYTITLVKQ
ncbi:MAG: hypothetical protein JNM28_04230 [Armatimonadetes bacterium]|nr:hypothetical protein [Armatimonadota bacterium]